MAGRDHLRSGGSSSDGFQPPAHWRRLAASDLGVADTWSVWYVDETGSTNADLLSEHAPDRTVLMAGHQTSGRGRLDRRWEAPPGANLLVSILLRDLPDSVNNMVRRVGIAAVDAVREVTGADARLKWPNDVLLGDRKLAGVLAQRSASGTLVVGLGLNVGWAPDGAAALGAGVAPSAVLAALLRSFDALPADVHDRYVELLDTIGRRVRIELPAEEMTATALGVERDGRLIVVDSCAVSHRIDAGDVVHLRADDG